MKILHVISTMRGGGAEKLMVDLLPRLKNMGIDAELVVYNGEKTPYRRELENLGVRIYDFGVNNSPYNPINIWRMKDFMKRYDIIHSHTTAPQIFTAVNKMFCSVPLCTTEHSTTNRRRSLRWFNTIDRWSYRKYNRIISISEESKTSLKDYLGSSYKGNITTIPNGIDVNRYINASSCEELDVIDNIIKIVMVASFRKAKDQDCIVRAISRLPEKYHAFFIGVGERQLELKNLAEKLKIESRIHFMGFRQDIPEILHSCDIYIQSSNWEGFGLAAVEGLAAGLPVIASNVEGLAQVVGEYGYLFPPQDDKRLSELILEIANNNNLKKPVKNNINRALNFDIGIMAKRYAELYEDMLNTTN